MQGVGGLEGKILLLVVGYICEFITGPPDSAVVLSFSQLPFGCFRFRFSTMTKAANGTKSSLGKSSMLKSKSKGASQLNEPSSAVLRYKGSKHFRQRWAVAIDARRTRPTSHGTLQWADRQYPDGWSHG